MKVMSPSRSTSFQSPINLMRDLAFLGRIDLREFDSFVIEENIHLIAEELVRIRIGVVESEVIDQLLLFLLPLGPTIFADLSADLLAGLGGNGRDAKRLALLPTLRAFEFIASE